MQQPYYLQNSNKKLRLLSLNGFLLSTDYFDMVSSLFTEFSLNSEVSTLIFGDCLNMFSIKKLSIELMLKNGKRNAMKTPTVFEKPPTSWSQLTNE